MRSLGLVNKLLRDCVGSSLVEFTLVFPIFILVALGTVDVCFLLFDFDQAHKATYAGAHRAIVTDPVDSSLKTITFPDLTKTEQPCFNATTGLLDTTLCPLVQKTCTGDGLDCANFDSDAFQNIFTAMQAVFPRLEA